MPAAGGSAVVARENGQGKDRDVRGGEGPAGGARPQGSSLAARPPRPRAVTWDVEERWGTSAPWEGGMGAFLLVGV